jgi:predicted acylesterase/phospholipase RssA
MAKKKVALVLSGGSSLGSYIAGALDELMRAFADAGDMYEIDIITGASAGATTGALIAHGLSYRGGDTSLHNTWVDQVDIVDLLDPNLPQGEPPSLLSSRRLQELAMQELTWKDGANEGQRATFRAAELSFAMTITNTTPLSYTSRIHQPASRRAEPYIEARNAEQESFTLSSTKPIDPMWQRIGEVARASAAIPFVFPLVRLARRANDTNHYAQPPNFEGERQFWYCDGGTFNNLPIDLAWYHHERRYGPDLKDRVMVVVNPWRRSTSPLTTDPDRPGLLQYGLGLVSAAMNESSAIQFQNEVILPSIRAEGGANEGGGKAIPGLNRPPVELLGNFALVMPRGEDSRLHGNHMQAMGAFLDRKFREYDFRRGAADARRAAEDVLEISYNAERPEGFYEPDKDPNFQYDNSTYSGLGNIKSSRDPNRSVREVFEEALNRRIDTLVDALNPPGPNMLSSHFVKQYVQGQLEGLWKQ